MARRHAHQLGLLKKLSEFDEKTLSATDRPNFRLFRRQVEVDAAEFAFNWHLVPLDHRNGIQDESSLGESLSFIGDEEVVPCGRDIVRSPRSPDRGK